MHPYGRGQPRDSTRSHDAGASLTGTRGVPWGLARGYLVVIPLPERETDLPDPTAPTMFVHSVYFWLRDDLSPADKAKFVDGIRSLTTIDVVKLGVIGTPADTNREIIDRSYSYALVVTFADAAAHDAYQVHPVHDAFRENCAGAWKKIVIYDAVSA
jgi:Stress responsive A/B Barrel Domain